MAYRLLPLHDPARRPRDWNLHVAPPRVAVFLSDARSGAELTADGTSLQPGTRSSFLLFDSLDEAKTYCEEMLTRFEHIQCDIYDQRGSAVPPLFRYTHERYRGEFLAPGSRKKLIFVGCLLILATPPLFWWDYRHGGVLIFPTLIALNCIILALRFFYMAMATKTH